MLVEFGEVSLLRRNRFLDMRILVSELRVPGSCLAFGSSVDLVRPMGSMKFESIGQELEYRAQLVPEKLQLLFA